MSPLRRPNWKRRATEVASAEADALISLPADVLDDILARVGLRDAVRTSALSRAWRHRWEALPSLNIHFPRLEEDEGAPKGLGAVDGILLRCPGRVRRFYVSLDELHADRLHDWLLVLPRRGVETLDLSFIDCFPTIPSSVFSCSRLTSLGLFDCAIPPLPPGFQGFPELRKFTLINVKLKENGEYQLEEIIATSPSLEKLTLWDVDIPGEFAEWVVQAPNLRYLKICSDQDYGWNFAELPRLDSAVIDICDYLGERDFSRFLASFATIAKLVLYTFHSTFNGANILERLTCSFIKLKSMALYTHFCEFSSILSTFCLLRNAPNLEKLKILIYDGDEQKFEANGEFQSAQCTDGTCANLQFVNMTGVHWHSNEMSFIELIMSKARHLRTLSISHDKKCSMSNDGAVKKLLNYKKASAHAEIVFKGKYSSFFCCKFPSYGLYFSDYGETVTLGSHGATVPPRAVERAGGGGSAGLPPAVPARRHPHPPRHPGRRPHLRALPRLAPRWEALPCISLSFLDKRGGTPTSLAVDRVLARYPGHISSFSFHFDKYSAGRVADWLVALCGRGVRSINLQCSYYHYSFTLHSSVFLCTQLVHLELNGCRMPPLPAGFPGFPVLEELTLYAAQFPENGESLLEEILGASPLLHTLNLSYLYVRDDGPADWTIVGPSVRKLAIILDKSYGWRITDLPRLDEATIDMGKYVSSGDFQGFIAGFARVRKLILHTCYPLPPVHFVPLTMLLLGNCDQSRHH
ncbi:hypothetical protein ACQ4PT_035992 [Festuca glaucescens]